MDSQRIYENISKRTSGDIYTGVVGPVRTGKSTFIKKFMDSLVIPNIENKYKKQRAIDELPQSGSGKTIMTCEPKFVPAQAVNIKVGDSASMNVRLVDCVGYVVEGANGSMEENSPRMVQTPWSDEPMEFVRAAEIGTRKVISTHSTIGIVVTTDGSFTDIPRSNYISSEEKVINELKSIDKPFVIILNTTSPNSRETTALKNQMEEKYQRKVIPLNVMEMNSSDIEYILKSILYEFPAKEICYELPLWISSLSEEHYINTEIYDFISSSSNINDKIRSIVSGIDTNHCEYFSSNISNIDLSKGTIHVKINVDIGIFFKVMSEENNMNIKCESDLFAVMKDLNIVKENYDKISTALKTAASEGYGIVSPAFDEYELKQPEMINKASRHGVKITAHAPAMHIISTDVYTNVMPTIGTKEECESFYEKLIYEYENDKEKLWESEFFGRNLKDMISDNMQGKLVSMDSENKVKIKRVLSKVVNTKKGGIVVLWM